MRLSMGISKICICIRALVKYGHLKCAMHGWCSAAVCSHPNCLVTRARRVHQKYACAPVTFLTCVRPPDGACARLSDHRKEVLTGVLISNVLIMSHAGFGCYLYERRGRRVSWWRADGSDAGCACACIWFSFAKARVVYAERSVGEHPSVRKVLTSLGCSEFLAML